MAELKKFYFAVVIYMIKKADAVIVFFILFFCGLISLSVFFQKNEGRGRYVGIYIDGKKEYSYVLDKNTYETVKIRNKYGYNEIIIKNQKVWITDSDCKGKDCIKMGSIENENSFIICSPHKLLIKIEEESDDDVQAISY